MAQLTPVDYDPFAEGQTTATLTPVDYDPFAEQIATPAPIFRPELPSPPPVSDKQERMGLTTQRGLDSRMAQAAQQTFITGDRKSRENVIKQLQYYIDQNIPITDPEDRLMLAQYQHELKFPEMEKVKTAKPAAEKAVAPVEPIAEKPYGESDFFGDIKRGTMSAATAITDKAMGMVQAAGELPGEVVKSVKNAAITKLWEMFPDQMQKLGGGKTKESILEQTPTERLKGKMVMAREAVQDIHQEIQDEIRKEGGLPAAAVQGISEAIMDTAITLGAARLAGGGKLPVRPLKSGVTPEARQAISFGTLVATTTEGDIAERAAAGAGAVAYVMAPMTVAGISSPWIRGAILTAEYIGMDVTSGAYGQAVRQAQEMAQKDGRSDDWKYYLAQTMSPLALQELTFGIMGAAGEGNKAAQKMAKQIPPEFSKQPTKGFLTPEQLAAQPSIESMPIEQPTRIELPKPKQEVPSATQEGKIAESVKPEYIEVDARGVSAEAGGGDRNVKRGDGQAAPATDAEITAPAPEAAKNITAKKMGDFYEVSGDDAKLIAPILDMPISKRKGAPNIGIMFNQLESAKTKLAEKGIRLNIEGEAAPDAKVATATTKMMAIEDRGSGPEWIDVPDAKPIRIKGDDAIPGLFVRRETVAGGRPGNYYIVEPRSGRAIGVGATQKDATAMAERNLASQGATKLSEWIASYEIDNPPKPVIEQPAPAKSGALPSEPGTPLPEQKTVILSAGKLFHNTDAESADSILKEGFTVQSTEGLSKAERGLVAGNLGDGVYLSPNYQDNMNRSGGEANVLVRPAKPLKLFSLGEKEGSAKLSQERIDEIKKQGYDGIIVNDPHPKSGGYQVVVFDPKNLRAENIVEQSDMTPKEVAGRDLSLSGEPSVSGKAPELIKGVELRDTKTGITYTVDNVIKPKGGQLAYVETVDRQGNRVKINAEDIGDRYVFKPLASAAKPAEPPLITPEQRANLITYGPPSESVARIKADEEVYKNRKPQPTLSAEEARRIAKMTDAELAAYNARQTVPVKPPAPAEPAAQEPGLKGVDNAAIIQSKIPVSQQPVKTQPISTKDVVGQIEESFGIPIRIGRFRNQAVGIYKQHPEIARTKVFGDIATATHEAAHHLDKTTKVIKNTPVDLRIELSKLDYEPDKARSSEGFAEYLRLKVTTDNEATLKAPKFDKWFEQSWLPVHPEWKSKIDAVKNITTQWRQEGAVNRVVGQINKESGRFPKLKEWVKNPHDLFRGIYDAVWNRQQPLWRAQEAITGTKRLADIPAEFRFAQAAKVLNMAAPTKVRQMAETGMTDVSGNKIGAGLKESLDPINNSIKTPEGQREFEAFLYARHALDVRKAGKEPGISQEDARFTADELGKRPGWNKAAEGVTKWFDGLLDYLIDAGGLTSESKAKMKSIYPNYIPLFRAMEGTQGRGAGGGKLADIGQPLQRLKGSGRQVISPLENAVVQAERIVGVADKIRIGRMLADASEHYQGVGKIIEKVSPDKKATSTTIKTMKDQLEKLGVDISDADMDSVLTIYENVYRGSTKDNVIVLWRNGKQEMYQVDPDVYSALTNLDQQFQLPKVADWILGKPTRLLRLTTTGLRAGFSMITNPLRDTMTSVMQTRTKGFAGSLPGKVAENIAGIYHDIMGTETARLFKAGGGEMGQPLAIDRVFTQEAISELLAKTPKQKALNWAKHPIDSMRQLLSVTELGPRLTEFERILKQKGWKEGQKLTLEQYLDAQMAAADVTVDFRQGGWMGMWLNRITAFHNANVQGPVQMVQAFKRNPTATIAKGTLWMTLPTLALWWKNKDEEWYKNLPDFEKYGYWHVPIGKSVIRVPRPFEWGVLFASIPEAIAQSAYEKDPQYMKDVVGQSLQILTPPVLPTAAKVPSEVFFNWDTFRRRPIVSKGLQNLKPEDQTYTSTTESANQLGKLFGVSPAKIEFLMSGYTGTLSTEIIRAGEAGARMLSSDIKKGTRPRELSDLPVVGRLFLRPNTTKIFDEFYAKAEELNRAYSSDKIHDREPSEQDASQRRLLNSTADLLSGLRKNAREIISDVKITDDDKRVGLQKIQDEMASLAKQALNKEKQP